VPASLDSYRERLEQMSAEALEEHYLHYSGRKATLELGPIYARYADLGTLEQAAALAEDAPRELYRFACETYVGNGLRRLQEDLANGEAALSVTVAGEEIPYRALRGRIMNEPDRARRAELQARRLALTEEHLNPILRELTERERELASDLGAGSVRELYERFGFDPAGLLGSTEAFLADTESAYRRSIEPLILRRVGVPLEPRAFCAPIRVPGRVVLVLLPQGGHEDYAALFHEAGHAEHFAHASPSLPAEQRLLGDNAVTEGFAFLLEHLVTDPAWLSARLDFGRSDDYLEQGALQRLFLIRRYAAKLAYELELNSGAPLESMPGRYAEQLGAATGIDYPAGDYLQDVDRGFYATSYLRAWAFEAQLRDFLRSEYDLVWFRRRAAGDLLRELWNLGQSLPAGELLREVSGQTLELGVLADDLGSRL
jgi:HPt (histidine-containing phosphotransfer) domain-containing protein